MPTSYGTPTPSSSSWNSPSYPVSMYGNQPYPTGGYGQNQPFTGYGGAVYGQWTPPPQQQPQQPAIQNTAPQGIASQNIPPIMLDTKARQNQLMALGAQGGTWSKYADSQIGGGSGPNFNGIQSNSGVVTQGYAQYAQDPMAQAALGAAKIGVEDQLTRDKQATKGYLGYSNADIDLASAGLDAQKIGMGGQNDVLRAITQLLGGSLSGLI